MGHGSILQVQISVALLVHTSPETPEEAFSVSTLAGLLCFYLHIYFCIRSCFPFLLSDSVKWVGEMGSSTNGL